MKRRFGFFLFSLTLMGLIAVVCYVFFRPRPSLHEIVLYGNVDVRQVDIGFRVPGLITTLMFEEGDRVEKGALMAVLDKTPYDSEVHEATAGLEAIKINLKNAEILLERREKLIGIGGVSQEDLDNARTERDQLRANLAQARASLNVALDRIGFTRAFCPTEGVILTRIREPGTVVNPADPVYTLSVTSPVWIRAFIDEPNLGKVYYGMEAEIHTDVEHGPVYTGHVGFISPIAEFTPKTVQTTELRTDLVYRLRVYADNPDRGLVQGMPVTVKLKLQQ